MNIKPANEAAQELAKVMKIDNPMIQSISIELQANCMAVAVVRIAITKEQWEEIGKTCK